MKRATGLNAAHKLWLDALQVEPDLLGPFDSIRAETVHTRVLAWAMSPARTPQVHGGLGADALFSFLTLALDKRWTRGVDLADVEAWPEHYLDNGKRVDIWIELAETIVAIEVKVDHFETDGQLPSYREAVGLDGHLVFLTRDGCAGDPRAKAIPVTFRQLLGAWLPVACSGTSGEHAYLQRYLKSVAFGLCDLTWHGPFAAWPLARQTMALDFLEEMPT